ncbi:MAG TPA: hypothetical protein VFQ84_05160 [Arenimonas sp.]|uniref:hypothetical protein n=1 Tax=Arenimonas sp. TaxID=1872635 RepID=UPI002D7E54C0|nr:hypothetical protein [Arenimonas sp.]HEU0152717.1 hypothetical protein [Arenimonas sp.]
MNARGWIALVNFGLFVVPAVLAVYAAWFDARGIGDGIYTAVHALSGARDPSSGDSLVSVGRFFSAWWWFIAIAMIGVSTLSATCLVATDPHASISAKAIWMLSFFLIGMTVPVYCMLQVGGRPNQPFKPTPSARLNQGVRP